MFFLITALFFSKFSVQLLSSLLAQNSLFKATNLYFVSLRRTGSAGLVPVWKRNVAVRSHGYPDVILSSVHVPSVHLFSRTRQNLYDAL